MSYSFRGFARPKKTWPELDAKEKGDLWRCACGRLHPPSKDECQRCKTNQPREWDER